MKYVWKLFRLHAQRAERLSDIIIWHCENVSFFYYADITYEFTGDTNKVERILAKMAEQYWDKWTVNEFHFKNDLSKKNKQTL